MEASLERKAETDQLSRCGTAHGQCRAELGLSQFVSGRRPSTVISVASAATLEKLGNGSQFPFHEHRFARMQIGDEIDEGAVGFSTGQLRCGTRTSYSVIEHSSTLFEYTFDIHAFQESVRTILIDRKLLRSNLCGHSCSGNGFPLLNQGVDNAGSFGRVDRAVGPTTQYPVDWTTFV